MSEGVPCSHTHYQTDRRTAIHLQQETKAVLPNCAMRNGPTDETSYDSRRVPNSTNHMSREELQNMRSNNTNQMGPSEVREELQPLDGETEQVLHVITVEVKTYPLLN